MCTHCFWIKQAYSSTFAYFYTLVLQCALKSPSETALLKVRHAVLPLNWNLKKQQQQLRRKHHTVFLLHLCWFRVQHDGSLWSDSESSLIGGRSGSRAFCLQHAPHLHSVQRRPTDTEHQVRISFSPPPFLFHCILIWVKKQFTDIDTNAMLFKLFVACLISQP